MKKNNMTFRELADQSLSELTWDRGQQNMVLQAVRREERPMKKISVAVLAAALAALIGAMALAAGLLSPGAELSVQADRALEKAYGVTQEMQYLFRREGPEDRDGGKVFVYTGEWELEKVLGTYTASFRNGKWSVQWSHDGESTEGGFDATAWGREQLNALLQLRKDRDMAGTEAAMQKGKGETIPVVRGPVFTEEEFDRYQQELASHLERTAEEMIETVREAVQEVYGLTEEQMQLLTFNPYLSSYYRMTEEGESYQPDEAGTLYFAVCLELVQNPSQDPAVEADYTPGDGNYLGTVNTETGVIEEIRYEASLAGNG